MKIGMWFAFAEDIPMDWMAEARQDKKGIIKIRMRLRLHASPDPWDPNDIKRWLNFESKAEASWSELEANMDLALKRAGEKLGLVRNDRIIADSEDSFINQLKEKSWAHIKTGHDLAAEDAQEITKES